MGVIPELSLGRSLPVPVAECYDVYLNQTITDESKVKKPQANCSVLVDVLNHVILDPQYEVHMRCCQNGAFVPAVSGRGICPKARNDFTVSFSTGR